jgi:hypothetical protein
LLPPFTEHKLIPVNKIFLEQFYNLNRDNQRNGYHGVQQDQICKVYDYSISRMAQICPVYVVVAIANLITKKEVKR